MRADNFDLAVAEQVVAVNFNGAMRLAAAVPPGSAAGRRHCFRGQRAGYRGLAQGALCYGPGKAALIHLCRMPVSRPGTEGYRRWLGDQPGFVSTQLTARNDFAMPALQTPEQAAQAVDGFAEGISRFTSPGAFTLPASNGAFRHPALPLVFPAHSPLHRRLT